MDDFLNEEEGEGFGGDEDEKEEAPVSVEEAPSKESKEESVAESDVLVKFRAEWRNRCIEKDKEGAEKKQALEAKARQALNDFAAQREDHKARRKATNRENEKDFLEQLASEKETTNSWARVVKMIDTKEDADTADVSRMKTLLIQLKNKPLVKRSS